MVRSLWRVTTSAAWRLEATAALRSLRRSPAYAVTAIGVLGLSLTVAILVFAVVDGILLRPLPYPRGGEVVAVTPGWKGRPIRAGVSSASASDFMAWQRAAPDVRFAAFSLGNAEQIDQGDRAIAAEVTAGLLDVLGQPPILGGFLPDHFVATRPVRPALITHACWQRRFSGDPAIVGRVLHGDFGRAIEVVGVLPPNFLFPTSMGRFIPEVLTPLVAPPNAETHRGRGWLVIARMTPATPLDALAARLNAATIELAARFPKRPDQPGSGPFDLVQVDWLDSALRTGSRTVFGTVFVLAAGLVLLACVNVTGLAAARTQDRGRELSLRRALGAGGGDVIRLLAIEAAVIVAAGTALGMAAASLLLPAVATLLPPEIALLKPLALDLRVVVFATAAAGLSVAVTCLWPARLAVAGRLRSTLAGGAATTRRQRGLARHVLIGTQVALALTMAIGGALLGGSWLRVWRQDTGYRAESTWHLWVVARAAAPWPEVQGLMETIRHVPGVQSAGAADIWMLQRAKRGTSYTEPPGAVRKIDVESFGVTAGFFDTTNLALLQGRWPTRYELDTGAAVSIVSESVATDYWPAQPAVGRTLTRKGRPFEVIGVVSDARYMSLDLEPTGVIYAPLSADPEPALASVFVRFERGRGNLKELLAAIQNGHKAFRVRRAQALTATLADSIRSRTFQTLLFGVFGAAAVVIAGVGVLGLTAMLASRRTREVGVRMALGARPAEIARLLVRQHLGGAWAGLVIGALLGAWLARAVGTSLYKTGGFDPLAWFAAFVVVTAATALGALLPAMRASRIDPVRALRVE
jgi:predicted permease